MTRLERSGVKQVWKNSIATCHESGLLRLTVRYCGILSFPPLDTPTGHVQTCVEICMPRSNTCLESWSWRSSQSSLALSSLNCSCYAAAPCFFFKEKKTKTLLEREISLWWLTGLCNCRLPPNWLVVMPFINPVSMGFVFIQKQQACSWCSSLTLLLCLVEQQRRLICLTGYTD